MKAANLLAGFTLGIIIATSAVMAEDKTGTVDADAKDNAAETKDNSSSNSGFSYRPPMRGAPAARIGGGTRGIGASTLELVVLAPDHTGFTTKEQPTLYWYASEPVSAQLEVTLINDESIDPELEQVVVKTTKAGIQSFDLSQTKAKLALGIEYRWFISAIADENQRSNDVVASGTIQRIKPSKTLKKKIDNATGNTLASAYAEEGIWYDTIDELSRMIKKSPDNFQLIAQRSALLEQVGLQTAANSRKTIEK
jgi:hypothetical protein